MCSYNFQYFPYFLCMTIKLFERAIIPVSHCCVILFLTGIVTLLLCNLHQALLLSADYPTPIIYFIQKWLACVGCICCQVVQNLSILVVIKLHYYYYYYYPYHVHHLYFCYFSLLVCKPDIFGISDHDLMYSQEAVEKTEQTTSPDKDAIQARVISQIIQ